MEEILVVSMDFGAIVVYQQIIDGKVIIVMILFMGLIIRDLQ